MHFDFTVSLGNLLVVTTLLGLGWKFIEPFTRRVWEHDTLWLDFARRLGFRVNDPKDAIWEKILKSEVK
jgi:hypothetical protein